MKISYNPLYKGNGQKNGALPTAPSSGDIAFDLPDKAIWAKGVKFSGKNNVYVFTHDDLVTIKSTSSGESTEVEVGVDVNKLRNSLLHSWDIAVSKGAQDLTTQWQDSDIDLSPLEPGVCLLHINYEGVHYSGTFTYAGISSTISDEIILHAHGTNTLARGKVFAKLGPDSQGVTKLWLATNLAEYNIALFDIKIKSIALL